MLQVGPASGGGFVHESLDTRKPFTLKPDQCDLGVKRGKNGG